MKIAESLEREGFATIDLADENKALLSATKEAVGAWEAFIKLPEDLKLRFSYSGDVAVGSGVGYELKKGTDGMDSKEDFHARAKSRAALLREAKKVGDVTAIEFVSAALNISTRLGPFVAAYTRSLPGSRALSAIR